MAQTSGLSSLISRSEENSYDIYFKDSSQRQRVKWKHIVCLFIPLIIMTGLLKIYLFNQPSLSYSRHHDPELLNFAYVSRAAKRLPKKGQLMCWVQTAEMYHSTRALAINETWLHRCDHGQLFTSALFKDDNIPYSTIFAGIPESYYNLFFKSRYAFHYIWKHISQDFDWYMKADDDTYVVVEHLREYLDTLDPNKPYYLGYRLRPYLKNGYNAGGAGYVLSREAMRLWNEEAYLNETICPDDKYEDVGMGRCLSNLGIYPHDTRNKKGQNRFNTWAPNVVFDGTKSLIEYIWFKEKKGYEAFASDMISFHHLTPDQIRLFDILLYRTRKPKEKDTTTS